MLADENLNLHNQLAGANLARNSKRLLHEAAALAKHATCPPARLLEASEVCLL